MWLSTIFFDIVWYMNTSKLPLNISVVIPVYNEERVIGGCLEALMPQLQDGDEVIVVDNNSKDRTVEIIKKHYPQVKIVRETRQGITYARTRGFDEAGCPIIARIDADTIVAGDWLTVIRERFTNSPATDAVGGLSGVAGVSPEGKIWMVWFSRVTKYLNQKKFKTAPIMFGHNMALTKQVWHKIRPTLSMGDKDITEDLDVTLAIHSIGGNVVHDPRMLVNIYISRFLNFKKIYQYHKSDIKTLQKYNII